MKGRFDHYLELLIAYPRHDEGRKPFKYFTMWRLASQFYELVKSHGDSPVNGSRMYKVVKKLSKLSWH